MVEHLFSAPNEPYEIHIKKALEKFETVCPQFLPTIKRIFGINDTEILKESLRKMVLFHDLGKLTKRWQKNLFKGGKNPAHAPIGGAYLWEILGEKELIDLRYSISFAIAIHHTDSGLLSDNIERPDVQAINDGIAGIDGKIKWHSGVKDLPDEIFPKELFNLSILDLKEMARGMRVWAKGCGLLEQHQRRLMGSLCHHILKLCDISSATERREFREREDYFGGFKMVLDIKRYTDNFVYRNRLSLLNKKLQRYVEILKNRYNPIKLILFGSLTKDLLNQWSDIDLLIIKDTDKPFFERLKEVILLLRPKVGIDILVYTPDELDSLLKERKFIQEIIEKGKVLYERGI